MKSILHLDRPSTTWEFMEEISRFSQSLFLSLTSLTLTRQSPLFFLGRLTWSYHLKSSWGRCCRFGPVPSRWFEVIIQLVARVSYWIHQWTTGRWRKTILPLKYCGVFKERSNPYWSTFSAVTIGSVLPLFQNHLCPTYTFTPGCKQAAIDQEPVIGLEILNRRK